MHAHMHGHGMHPRTVYRHASRRSARQKWPTTAQAILYLVGLTAALVVLAWVWSVNPCAAWLLLMLVLKGKMIRL